MLGRLVGPISRTAVIGSCKPQGFMVMSTVKRSFNTNNTLHNTNSGSLFGNLTQSARTIDSNKQITPKEEEEVESLNKNDNKDPYKKDLSVSENDEELQKFHQENAEKDQILVEKYVTPLKRALFEQVVKKHGFFKNNEIITNEEDGKTYKINLTPQEIEVLEPSVLVQSYRLKSSLKKATVVNRFVRGMPVKNAINQLHFNPKKMSTEVEKLLKRGLELAKKAGLEEDSLYIDELWVGSDGKWKKRPDWKGRGRVGIIKHPFVHVKAVLKTNQTRLRRQFEKDSKQTKPRMFLNNEPLNFKVRPFYKW
ncbi:ribosomal protein L22/L17 [Scheffersomyces amazonensis]|uniref:ribosomal protein L22/L17 n=1 Tax=Scheffersomyces amazonensis TaxID=1078765 RepID=UPI00315CDB23